MSSKKDPKAVERQLSNWRENASYMYERLDTISLEWPTLTAQWDPTDTRGEHAFVASYTNGTDREYVRKVVVDTNKIAPRSHTLQQWSVPSHDWDSEDFENENEKGNEKGNGDSADAPTDEVQKLRICPDCPSIVAGISAFEGRVYIWDTSDFTTTDARETLKGHKLGGFGLAWQPKQAGSDTGFSNLATGADDGKVRVWEVGRPTPDEPLFIDEFQAGAPVNDVTWDWDNTLVVSCDNGKVLLLEYDSSFANPKVTTIDCRSEGVNTAALSPFAKHLLVTGSSDNYLRLWDTRRPNDPPLYENQVHTGRINVVKWSPHKDGVFASGGMDGVVLVWNINNIGLEQTEEDAEDGPPELMFNHSGHLSGEQVQDLDWHPTIPLLLLSADENNTLMSWQATNEAIGEPKVPKMPSFLI